MADDLEASASPLSPAEAHASLAQPRRSTCLVVPDPDDQEQVQAMSADGEMTRK